MQSGDNVVRIGTSPMTPGQYILKLWPTVQELCPGVKFQLIPFENTPQNARDILRNLGRDIDIRTFWRPASARDWSCSKPLSAVPCLFIIPWRRRSS